jgi:hypothetical protein
MKTADGTGIKCPTCGPCRIVAQGQKAPIQEVSNVANRKVGLATATAR